MTSLLSALSDSLESTPHLPRDLALVRLAERYAEILDDLYDSLGQALAEEEAQQHRRTIDAIAKIGARYEQVLDKMGMSPGSRTERKEGATPDDPADGALNALRDGAAAPPGVDPTAAVDPSVAEADAGD